MSAIPFGLSFRRTRLPEWALIICVVLFGGFQLLVSFHKLYTLQANMMDLGDFRQELWQISHGNWWAFGSVFQTPAVAQDGFVLIYPIAYGYRFLGGLGFLFFIQAAGTAAAAWGIYRAGLLHRLSSPQASLVAILFLLYPAVIGGSQYDFHPDFIALPFLVWAYVSYQADRRRAYYWLLLLAAISKNIALVSIAGWGIGLILYKRKWRDGLVTFLGSVAFFLLEVDLVIPRFFNGGTNRINLSLYSYLGHGFTGVMVGMITHFPLVVHQIAQHGSYALWLFAPVLGLSLLGSASLPAVLSLFLLNSLAQFHAEQMIGDQYQVMLGGWMFLALVEGLARFRTRRLWLAGLAISTALFESVFLITTIVPFLIANNSALPAVRAAVRSFPTHAVVWTQNRLGLWAYRYPYVGVDRKQVPRVFDASLPVLWREAGPVNGSHTAILGMRPVSPFFADLIGVALASGYRISFHQGSVFVVSGSRHFQPPAPSMKEDTWEPQSRSWTIPAWTQAFYVARVDWKTKWVLVRQDYHGIVFSGVPIVVWPGIYQFSVTVPGAAVAGHQILGYLSTGRHNTVAIRAGRKLTYLRLTVSGTRLILLSLTSSGRAPFSVQSFSVERLQTATPPASP